MFKFDTSNLTVRIFLGMLAGIGLGLIFRQFVSETEDFLIPLGIIDISIKGFFVDGILHAGGQIFINSLKMLVVPLVFVSIVCGTCSLTDPKKLGRLGGKSVGLYILTTALAITLALTLALIFKPGEGIEQVSSGNFNAKEAPSLVQIFIDMFPTNPIEAMAKGNMLQIIVFAVLFGIATALIGPKGKRIAAQFEDLNNVIMRIVTILMNLAPYGVFCLMAKLFTYIDMNAIGALLKYFMLVVVALLLHGFITYSLFLKFLTGLSPVIFFTKMREAAMFAFGTASSSATIPVSLETATHKLGARNSTASFTIPLGSTINMDGTAIMQGVATVFIAQFFAVDLTLNDYLMVVFTATLASIGTAGVPGVGLIMLAMVLTQVNLPVEGIALIIGVDRLLDMLRTALNVSGDCMVTCVVAKSEGELDETVFNDMHAGLKDEEVHFPQKG
ncbi:dicarboxylate/amino acid:cation symporter [Catenovulum sp. SM1970]|uniref:dicarboxylate/amino acid:cation symporter n=1 Tax=Marinifaba aquimaris TaxID=2741323 RepID=UPI00157322A0|nr:dicarboxylate/amino acid:cation symporter [Marinifaba aquimaris]NTS75979.1 dicarboxylate/amino acid:cation symporter [Marinifaba aquimaris]